MTSSINRLVLAIKSVESGETLERWQFDVHTDEQAAAGVKPPKSTSSTGAGAGGKKKEKEKTEKEVQGEIREIMKQITSSVTFLPILEEQCMCYFLTSPSRRSPKGKEIQETDGDQAHLRCSHIPTSRVTWRYRPLGTMPIRT